MRSFDEKWGSKILIGALVITCLYFVPVSVNSSVASSGLDSNWDYYYNILPEKIATEAKVPAVFSWKNVFSRAKKSDNGQHLYLLIYENSKVGPSNEAQKQTAEYFGYSKENMIQILDGYVDKIDDYDVNSAEYDWTGVTLDIEGLFDHFFTK